MFRVSHEHRDIKGTEENMGREMEEAEGLQTV